MNSAFNWAAIERSNNFFPSGPYLNSINTPTRRQQTRCLKMDNTC